MGKTPDTVMSMWYLEGDFNNDGGCSLEHIQSLPVTLGRDDSAEFTIPSPSVSRQHARIDEAEEDRLIIHDLQSSNGTFVNREKISSSTEIGHGDIIHLGTLEFRLIDRSHLVCMLDRSDSAPDVTEMISISNLDLSDKFPSGVPALEELISKKQIQMLYQPIVLAKGLSTCGYEALARGTSHLLSPDPTSLFRIAESVGLEVKLSTLMRELGAEIAARNQLKGMILLKSHSKELENCDNLLESLILLRKKHPKLLLMLEVNELAVTDLDHLSELKRTLANHGIKLAFDDFGVGQSRLMEIVGAKPDLVKFDRALIEGIDKADSAKLSLVMHLNEMVSELRIKTLAECVGDVDVYHACKDIGFDLYQGFYFGMPLSAEKVS